MKTNQNLKLNSNALKLVVLAIVTITLATACTFKRPGIEEPPINSLDERINKNFFVNQAGADGKTEPKTFLCAWAPIRERAYAQWQFAHAAATNTMHCNVEWIITENAVVGHQIDPSYPNDRSQWKKIISIPIESHYHYEPRRDSRGRDTIDYIKNTQRDPWNRRPHMDLNLKGIQFHAGYMKFFRNGTKVVDIRDIEWDSKNGFLGFTIDAMDAAWGSSSQAQFRVNFKSFKHNPNFKKTPYHEQNSRYLNALHILGKQVEGTEPVLYAGHWDLSKTHTIYLNGFNERYRKIVVDSVEDWNKAFAQVGAVKEGFKPFIVADKELKYPIDLRYPTITWIDDRRISSNSGLGIGLASSDVRNGEILWGGVVLYGGMIDRYVRAYNPSDSVSMSTPTSGLHLHKFFKPIGLDKPLKPLFGDSSLDYMLSPEGQGHLHTSFLGIQESLRKNIEQRASVLNASSSDEAKIELAELQNRLVAVEATINSKVFEASNLNRYIREDYAYKGIDGVLPNRVELFEKDFNLSTPESLKIARGILGENFNELSQDEQDKHLETTVKEEIYRYHKSSVFDRERTFQQMVPQWNAGISERMEKEGTVNLNTAADGIVKGLALHEIGHFLGLGHQFKGNYMPKRGTVPDKYLDGDPQCSDNENAPCRRGLLAMAQANDKNYTTVMDYSNGRSEIYTSKEEWKPGPHDLLVLRYLYKKEFPVFKTGDQDFAYKPVPENGLIPQDSNTEAGQAKTAYFEACTDIEASLNMDPFCRRWDRGHNAYTIAKSLMEDFKANLVYLLNAFTSAKGGHSNRVTGYLFYNALRTFTHARTFYDEMRLKIEGEPKYANAFKKIRRNQASLYNFSKYCLEPEKAPTSTQSEFKTLVYENGQSGEKTEIHDFCRANVYVLEEFKKLLERKGSDQTIVDYDQSYVPSGISGGDAARDWGSLFGRYKEISYLPVRLSALLALTTPSPWFMWGPWQIPIAKYAGINGRFSYQTLFPYQFMGALNAAVKDSLRFGGTIDQEAAEMGRLMLYLPSFLFRNNYLSNDKKNRFPQDYIENLRAQTQFNFQLTPIILTKIDPPQGKPPTRAFKFKTTYFDMAKRSEIDLPLSYILPENRILAKGLEGQFFLPMTRFRFVNDKVGYIWSLEMNYTSKHDDPLSGVSVRAGVAEEYQSIVRECESGNGNGLSSFFNETNNLFPGFEVLSGIATDKGLRIRFEDSIKDAFNIYWDPEKNPNYSSPEVCEESLKGIGLIISSSALLNGFWTAEAFDYLMW